MNYSLPQQDLINVNGSNCLPSSPGSSGCFNCTILTNAIVPAINSALSCFVGEGIHNCLSLPSPTYVSTYLFPTFYGAGVVLPNSTTNPTLDPTSPSFSIGNWLLVTLSQIVGFVIGQPIDLLALSNYLVDFLTSTQLDIDACSLPGAIFPDCKVGLLYYIKTLISCNWCNMNQCQEGWGLEKALLAILLAFVIVSIVVSLFLDFLSPFLIILWFYYPLTVICFAYNVHPTCLLSTFPYFIPSFPVCLFDDVCTLLHNIAYDYFPWEVILPGLLITGPGGTRTFLPCASIGFTGIVNELFFALQWALPRVTNFLRTTDIVFFSWIRDVTVIATGLSTFTFTGSPTDAQVSCFLINLLSLVPIVLIGILAIYLLVLLIPIIVAFLLLLRDLAAIFILFMVALLKRNASKQARLDSQSVAESGRLPITDTLDPSANAITVTLPPSQASALPLHHQQMPPTQAPPALARERALLWEEPAQPTHPPPVDIPGYAGTLQPPERSGVRELAGALQRGVNSLRKRKNG